MNARSQGSASPHTVFLLVALVVIAAFIGVGLRYSIPALIGFLVGVNVATVLLYGYDKAVAGGKRTRVPERILHIVALIGGSPAALLSQVLFRHKTVKTSFQRMYWLIVALQVLLLAGALWGWLHPPAWLPGFLRSA